jgi:hypothetical protein
MGFLFFLVGVIHILREMFRPKDYSIRKVILEYGVTDEDDLTVCGKFWETQKKSWEFLPDVYAVDVKGQDFIPLPKCLKNPLLKVVYFFNNKEYVYITNEMDYQWPPEKASSMRFVLPFKNAVLVDDADVPVKNITSELFKYAGPRFDFHGSPIPIADMIVKPFMKLRMTNILNQQSTINLGG